MTSMECVHGASLLVNCWKNSEEESVLVLSVNTVNNNTEMVISKETVWNFWDILNVILGHKYHQKHSNMYGRI